MSRRGMAIVIVLGFSTILFILGTMYIKRFQSGGNMSPVMLRRIQVFHFGEGMQKIALLKYKMLPTDFYHSYKYELELKKKTPGLIKYSPSPMEAFIGAKDTPLMSMQSLMKPLDKTIASYTTTYMMAYNNQYNRDVVEISLTVGSKNEKGIIKAVDYVTKTVVNASRTRILTF
ncbi:MAG: hypothetical protein HQM10_09715 [Candidatus Riflebacteria bacterium]|nr:hypothetical protein [Candidatus Riflebacteria bacterium]